MPQQPIRRKRRPNQGPSKNELRSSRNESQAQQKARSGSLRENYPQVRKVHIEFRLETVTGAVLEKISRGISLDEALMLDIPCQGGCGNGVFLLTDAIGSLLQANSEKRDGMALCQASSYSDSNVPCGTKLIYSLNAEY